MGTLKRADSSLAGVLDHSDQLGPDSQRRIEELINLEFSIQKDISDFKEMVAGQQDLQEFADSIKAKLDTLQKMLEDVHLYAEEQDRELEKEAVLKNVRKRQKEWSNLNVSLRHAKLLTKDNLRKFNASERDLLLEKTGEDTVRRRRVENQKSAVKMSQNITAGLQRARNLISDELERTNSTMTVLDNSSSTLNMTLKEWNNFSGAVGAAKNVLNRMGRRDRTDKILIGLGFIFFILVVLYVLRRRLKWLI